VEHRAEFVSYRARTIDTVLGTVTFRRVGYHCVEALVTFYYQARTWAAAGPGEEPSGAREPSGRFQATAHPYPHR
jgi:hypothetical protein